jgi:MraZ protein
MSDVNIKPDETQEGFAFAGPFAHSLDPKKRLTIPSGWRTHLGGSQLFVFPGIGEPCLTVFPAREMTRRMRKLRSLPVADIKGQQYVRAFFARVRTCDMDGQGRVLLNEELLEYAGLVNQVMLIGKGDHFELWSPERWKDQESKTMAGFEEAARFLEF